MVRNVLARDLGCFPERFNEFIFLLLGKACGDSRFSGFQYDGGDVAVIHSHDSITDIVAKTAGEKGDLQFTHMFCDENAYIQGYDTYDDGKWRSSMPNRFKMCHLMIAEAQRRDISPEQWNAMCEEIEKQPMEDDFEI